MNHPSSSILDPPDSFCFGKTSHGGMQGEADVNHPILEGTYLLFHCVCLLNQLPVPVHLGPKPSVFFVDEGGVNPLRSRIFVK